MSLQGCYVGNYIPSFTSSSSLDFNNIYSHPQSFQSQESPKEKQLCKHCGTYTDKTDDRGNCIACGAPFGNRNYKEVIEKYSKEEKCLITECVQFDYLGKTRLNHRAIGNITIFEEENNNYYIVDQYTSHIDYTEIGCRDLTNKKATAIYTSYVSQ